MIETRARFGFTAAPATTDDGRMRRITQHVPIEYLDGPGTGARAGSARAMRAARLHPDEPLA
ncbi:hypothetical protein AB0D54_34265 [Streptomyces xanthophaeus]|uniref:hypothetical protein n=1 Tax=Streptomyces xanthophaeus TaxID=67385 RepID=UPI003428EDD4